jgi:hypothetical protein
MDNYTTKIFTGKKKKPIDITETKNVEEINEINSTSQNKNKEKIKKEIPEIIKEKKIGSSVPQNKKISWKKSDLYNFLINTENIVFLKEDIDTSNILPYYSNIIIIDENYNFTISSNIPNTKIFISKNKFSRLNIYLNIYKLGTIYFENYVLINFNFNRYYLFSPAIIYPDKIIKICETVSDVIVTKIYTNKYYIATNEKIYIGNLLVGNTSCAPRGQILDIMNIEDLWVNNHLYVCTQSEVLIYDNESTLIQKLEKGYKYFLYNDIFAIYNNINTNLYKNLEIYKKYEYSEINDFCIYRDNLYILIEDKLIIENYVEDNRKEIKLNEPWNRIIVKNDIVLLWDDRVIISFVNYEIVFFQINEIIIDFKKLTIKEKFNNVNFDGSRLIISTNNNLLVYKYDNNFELISNSKLDIQINNILEFSDIIGLISDKKCVYYIG